jgi:hypothetical protein
LTFDQMISKLSGCHQPNATTCRTDAIPPDIISHEPIKTTVRLTRLCHFPFPIVTSLVLRGSSSCLSIITPPTSRSNDLFARSTAAMYKCISFLFALSSTGVAAQATAPVNVSISYPPRNQWVTGTVVVSFVHTHSYVGSAVRSFVSVQPLNYTYRFTDVAQFQQDGFLFDSGATQNSFQVAGGMAVISFNGGMYLM